MFDTLPWREPARVAALQQFLEQRILVLDAAMGTAIQDLSLEEADYRGERFRDHQLPQRGNNDMLTLSAPHHIAAIHRGRRGWGTRFAPAPGRPIHVDPLFPPPVARPMSPASCRPPPP
jgi:hypothetical protein